jgi:hypothetical protein
MVGSPRSAQSSDWDSQSGHKFSKRHLRKFIDRYLKENDEYTTSELAAIYE